MANKSHILNQVLGFPRSIWNFISGSRKLVVGIILFLSIPIVATIVSGFIPYDVETFFRYGADLPPSSSHLLGTDGFGRDMWELLMVATRNTLFVGVIAAIVGTTISVVIGFIGGYFRHPALSLITRWLTDTFITMPTLPFVILITSILKVELIHVALIIAVFGWGGGARSIMAQTLSIREKGFINTVKISGAGNIEAFKDIFINLLPFLISSFVNVTRGAMIAEAGISILGVGRYKTTLGIILNQAVVKRAAIVKDLWWWWSSPVIVFSIVLAALFLINIGFDEVIDPRLKR